MFISYDCDAFKLDKEFPLCASKISRVSKISPKRLAGADEISPHVFKRKVKR